MGSRSATTSRRRETALNAHLAGRNQRDIARDLGISQPAVSRLLSDSECKAIIDKCHREIVSAAPEINQLFIQDCRAEGKLGLEARKRMQDIIGIAPSHTQSIFIQTIFQGNNQVIGAELGSILQDLLGSKHALPSPSPAIIDTTPIDTSKP